MFFWFWGMWLYFRSDVATEPEQERIRSLVVKLAARGEREVVPENQYSYLTLDGVPDPLLQMDQVLPHEILRLPMFDGSVLEIGRNLRQPQALLRRVTTGGSTGRSAAPPNPKRIGTTSNSRSFC